MADSQGQDLRVGAFAVALGAIPAWAGSDDDTSSISVMSISGLRTALRSLQWRARPQKKALGAAERLLETGCNDTRTVIVSAHHPLHGPRLDGPNATIGGDRALAVLANGGANAVLSGHIHVPFDEVRKEQGSSVQVIGAGTLSMRLRHGAPASYNVLARTRGAPAIAAELRELPAANR